MLVPSASPNLKGKEIITEPERQTPVIEVDVIVVGGVATARKNQQYSHGRGCLKYSSAPKL